MVDLRWHVQLEVRDVQANSEQSGLLCMRSESRWWYQTRKAAASSDILARG
jgi:hypothetical protein